MDAGTSLESRRRPAGRPAAARSGCRRRRQRGRRGQRVRPVEGRRTADSIDRPAPGPRGGSATNRPGDANAGAGRCDWCDAGPRSMVALAGAAIGSPRPRARGRVDTAGDGSRGVVADLAPAPPTEPAKPVATQGIPRDRTAVRMSEVAPPRRRRCPRGSTLPDASRWMRRPTPAASPVPPARRRRPRRRGSPHPAATSPRPRPTAPSRVSPTTRCIRGRHLESSRRCCARRRWPAPLRAVQRASSTVLYFEVLVAADGTVETVRIRGRIEPGETFYRHRMLLAAAKLWKFTPARLNGRPVRYVTRVVIEPALRVGRAALTTNGA